MSRPEDSRDIEARSPRLVGYARVSTDKQTTALQELDALRAAGCSIIHEDSASGASRSQPGLDRAIADLAPGDTLVVWRGGSRLGRSLRALLDVAKMPRERGVSLRSLTEQIDTGTAAGKMLYAVLGAVAQFERDVIRERTFAGLVAAKGRGERIGRPPALAPVQRREAQIMLDRGESVAHVARALRVGRSTIIARWQRNDQDGGAGSFPRFQFLPLPYPDGMSTRPDWLNAAFGLRARHCAARSNAGRTYRCPIMSRAPLPRSV